MRYGDGTMTDDERKDYEEAQRLIAKANATGATDLVLAGLSSLTTLPPELAQLTALTSLNVSVTPITDLTPLAKLTEVR
jgi:Leucine-rich repeat (LRR) protein